MTKRQELEILADAIAKLGPDSYLGPWLSNICGEVERAIRSDFFPEHNLKAAQADCATVRAEAKAAQEKAHQSARDIIAAAERTVHQDAVDRKKRFNDAIDRAVYDMNGTKFCV